MITICLRECYLLVLAWFCLFKALLVLARCLLFVPCAPLRTRSVASGIPKSCSKLSKRICEAFALPTAVQIQNLPRQWRIHYSNKMRIGMGVCTFPEHVCSLSETCLHFPRLYKTTQIPMRNGLRQLKTENCLWWTDATLHCKIDIDQPFWSTSHGKIVIIRSLLQIESDLKTNVWLQSASVSATC